MWQSRMSWVGLTTIFMFFELKNRINANRWKSAFPTKNTRIQCFPVGRPRYEITFPNRGILQIMIMISATGGAIMFCLKVFFSRSRERNTQNALVANGLALQRIAAVSADTIIF